MTSSGHDITVVGSINADLTMTVPRHPRPGETLTGRGGLVKPGGKGANQAVAAALLGAEVHLVGAVGDDANAGPALSGLIDAGVDLTGLARVPGPTGLAVIVVDAAGENTIVISAGANGHMDAAAVAAQERLIADSSIVLLQGEIPRSGFEAAARACTGRLVVNLAPVVEVDPDLLRRADPLIVNEHEGALTLALLTGEAPRPDTDAASWPALTRALRDQGIASVVMTIGAAGAIVVDDTGEHQIPSPRVRAVDTTGAGDAFVGALCWRLTAGDSLVDAARVATRVGAYACTGAGAQPSYPRVGDDLPS